MSAMLGEALAAACADRDVLARIAGPIGEAARRAAGELARLGAGPGRAKRAAWAAIARAPIPAGLRGADPSWIEAGLAGLPARARGVLAGGAEAGRVEAARADDVPMPIAAMIDVWLARLATAAIPPLPRVDPAITRPRVPDDVPRMTAAAVRAWLEDVGADQLAFALGDAQAIAAAARIVGPRLVAAAERITRAPRSTGLGPRRAAIGRARVDLDDRALLRIGARALAPRLDALTHRQLAVRLHRSTGVLAELVAHGAIPPDHAPSWDAIAASG